MARVAYVNGAYVALADARVSIEDRGYQFADGVYEVCAVMNGTLLDWQAHLERLGRSMDALAIIPPMSPRALALVAHGLLRRNHARDALLYVQVTRGVARRDHTFPRGARSALVMTVRPFDFRQRLGQQATGVRVITLPDERWRRCDIKSVSLLPNVLAKQAARSAGAFEAWLVGDDGTVREGSSTNAWMVDAAGRLHTHPASPHILSGVMQMTLIRLAEAQGIPVERRAFSIAEARGAPELFLSSTTAPCLPVVQIDDQRIGNGRPGPVAQRLAALLWNEIERQTGFSPEH